jgi:FtsZ-binding cell division protein ZapB
MTSQVGETEGVFQARLAQVLRERRDLEVEKLKARYAPRLQGVQDQVRRARERVEREKSQYGQQKVQTAISVGASLLGAFLGRRALSAGNVSRAATAMRSAGRIGREKEDVDRAGESLAAVEGRLVTLQQEFDADVSALQGRFEPGALVVERTTIRPRKSDIGVGTIGLAWIPWKTGPDGLPQPA